MRAKKIFTALSLTGLMLVSLTACGAKKADSVTSTASSAEAESTEEAASSQSVSAASEEKAAAPASEGDYTVGTTDGSVYTNTFFQMKFDAAGNGYTLADADQLKQLANIAADATDSKDVQKLMDEGTAYMDMYAYLADQTRSVNIMVQNMGVVYGVIGNIDATIDASMDALKQQVEVAGLSDVQMNKTTCTFLGVETPCVDISGTANGVTVYEKQVYVQSGSYLATVTVSSVMEDHTQEVLDAFTKAE